MEGSSFIIRVEKVRSGSTVPVGLSSPPLRDCALVGRSVQADFQLSDPTVASEHIRLETAREGFSIRVLTERGTTFINRQRAKRHDVVLVQGDRAWLQIGRVLISVTQIIATLPFDDQVSIPAETFLPQTHSWLTVQAGQEPRVWIHGEPMSLFPSAARVLCSLSERPGEVVSQSELKKAMDPSGHHLAGGTNLNQAITYIRNMFDQALRQDLLEEALLRRQVQHAHRAPPLEGELSARRALLRALVQSERGVGYRLRLSPEHVSTLP